MEFNSLNSKEWLSSLLSYFMSIKSIDDNIESLRIALCSKNDFIPNQLFRYLDLNNKNFLLLNDFTKFLNEMQIPFDEKYARKFIHNFDKDNDFCLNFQEFLGLILPKKNNDLKQKILLNINNKYFSDIISENAKSIFGKLLCEELELIKNCIKTAKICQGSKGFTNYLAFIEIAGNDKYITESHLFNFLKKNNIGISTNDMHQLMFRLDADDDGRISFNEFEEIFFPMKEGESTYKKTNSFEEDNNYNFYTVSSLSSLSDMREKQEKKTFNNDNNNIDFTFGQNKKINILTIKKENMNETNPEMNNIINNYSLNSFNNKNYNYNYPNDKNKTKHLYENKSFNLKTNTITKSYNILPTYKKLKSLNHSYLNSNQNLNNSNENILSSTFDKTSSFKDMNYNSFTSKVPTNRLKQNNLNYKSPKLKHTNTPLHYDYSTYSDEDGDEYFRNRRLGQGPKTDINRNYRTLKYYNNEEITKIKNQNHNDFDFPIENKITFKPCCGCSSLDTLCPCPIIANSFENCICPKNVKSARNIKNNLKMKNSYKTKLFEEIKNNSNGFSDSLNSEFFKTKSQFNFTYNNDNEKIINERRFDEKRLLNDY